MIKLYDGKKLVGNYATIQAAVDAASEGDTIKLGAGTFYETVTVDVAVNFEGAGDGTTIMDGTSLTGSGLHLVGDLGDHNEISISGISFNNYSVAGVEFDDDAILEKLKIEDSHFEANAMNGVRVGGDYDPVALDKVEIKNSSFENNGDGTSNGDGDILFFQYYGDAKIEDVTITGGGTGDNAIQFRGDDGPIGKVELKDVTIDGAYAKTGIAVYNYSDGDGLKFKDTTVTAVAGWGKPVVVDDVGGKIDAKGLETSGAPGLIELAGDDSDNDIKAGDGASILVGKGGEDKLKGSNFDDVLFGGAEDDKLEGRDGDDALVGESGNDKIDGGKGYDTAVYSGAFSDYDIDVRGKDNVDIVDLRGGSPDGTDELKKVELLIFTNGTTDVSDDTYFDVATQTAFVDETEFRFQQGFEVDRDGIIDYGSTVSRVASGTNGIDSATGDYHAELTESDAGGAFTRFSGYNDTFESSWTASVQVYLDADDDGSGWAAGEGFDYSVASSGSDGNHQRDFIFHVTQDTSSGELLINASNNTNFAPREDLDTNPQLTGPATVNVDGWYRFEHVFRDDGGVLAVDMNVYDDTETLIFTTTRSNPSDTIPTEVGGNRYGWFTNIDIVGGIEVDDVELFYDADQTFGSPTVDDLFA